ncbi:MAG: alpha/beta fold hydrolase [Oligoflexia bacterium]|nr:alpha/beta fold hydrolase [Oligoflexia bacterium]
MRLYLLHGFLGLPSDWDTLPWSRFLPGVKLEKVDLLGEAIPPSAAEWAKSFCSRVQAGSRAGEKAAILGYSMGGRLAMHALLEAPELFHAGALVSANPGLRTAGERQARREADEGWARRFERDEWARLIADWDAQPVFGGDRRALERKEGDFDRTRLAAALRNWSVGSHEDLLARLGRLPVPLLWVAGEKDRKYAGQLERLPPGTLSEKIPGAGHRVPWEAPERFLECVAFINGPRAGFRGKPSREASLDPCFEE